MQEILGWYQKDLHNKVIWTSFNSKKRLIKVICLVIKRANNNIRKIIIKKVEISLIMNKKSTKRTINFEKIRMKLFPHHLSHI